MRLLPAVLLAGACSFEHGSLAVEAGDGGGGGSGLPDSATIDPPPVDAAAAVVDAPPPPCADDDNDNVCNTVDDWPCGVKPSAPSATMAMSGNNGATDITITNVNLDGTGRLAVATPTEEITLALSYTINDTACPQNCVDQLEIGWVPGSRIACVFDDTVSKSSGAMGNVMITIGAPSTAQVYDLRANIGQNYSCTYNGANNWWGGAAPPSSRTIAKLCVH